MKIVRVIQLLCPERHCVLCVAYESATGEADPEKTERLMQEFKNFNPWCELCSSRDLRPEDRPTGFKTLDEATPSLKLEEAKQLALRARILEERKVNRN